MKEINARRYDRAVEVLDRAIAADPQLAVAYVAKGSALVGLRRYEEAVRAYEKALLLDRGMASPLFGLGEAYRALGQRRKAAAYYQRYADSRARDADPRLQEEARRWASKLR